MLVGQPMQSGKMKAFLKKQLCAPSQEGSMIYVHRHRLKIDPIHTVGHKLHILSRRDSHPTNNRKKLNQSAPRRSAHPIMYLVRALTKGGRVD